MKMFEKTMGVLLLCGSLLTTQAQSGTPLSKHANAVKQKIDRLSPQAHISVIPVAGGEEYGDFSARDQESFTFYDVDKKADVTLRYDAVKTIRNVYGGYNSVQHRHVDRHKTIIIVAVVVAVLGAVIGAAAAAK